MHAWNLLATRARRAGRASSRGNIGYFSDRHFDSNRGFPAGERRERRARAAAVIGGLILAAGAGRRFGGAKQLAALDGRPLLEHALLAMAGARRIDRTVVVLGAHADAVLAEVERHGALPVLCADWEEGQAASLRAGVASLAPRVEAIVVILGDQPAIDSRAIDRVAEARDGISVAIRASYGGRAGHPILLERSVFAQVPQLRGDRGARSLLRHAGVRLVACDGLGSDGDIDTAEQLRISAGGSGARS